MKPAVTSATSDLDQLSVNTIRTLAVDIVQQAGSGESFFLGSDSQGRFGSEFPSDAFPLILEGSRSPGILPSVRTARVAGHQCMP